MEQLQSMGLALVIFIAAYLKMSTPEITTRHTVLYSPPLCHRGLASLLQVSAAGDKEAGSLHSDHPIVTLIIQ